MENMVRPLGDYHGKGHDRRRSRDAVDSHLGLRAPSPAALTGAAAGSAPSRLIPRPDSTLPEPTSSLSLRSRERLYGVDLGRLSSTLSPKIHPADERMAVHVAKTVDSLYHRRRPGSTRSWDQ